MKKRKLVMGRALFIGVVFLLIVLILFFVSKFVIRDFREFLGFEKGEKKGIFSKSEVSGERILTAPGSSAEAIALWAYPDSVTVSGAINVGVVAYHHSGINRIEFSIDNGSPISVIQETINPNTGEYEYVLQIDTTTLSDDTSHVISAIAYPNNGVSSTLPNLIIQVDNTPNYNTWYVDSVNGNDANSGSSSTPFATILKAFQSARGGDTIKLRTGEYLLDAQGPVYTKYVTIMPDSGASPKITSTTRLNKNFIKLVNLTFNFSNVLPDRSDGGYNQFILYGYSINHIWVDGSVFIAPKGKYNNYINAIRIWGDSKYIYVKNSRFIDVDLAVAVFPNPPAYSILRGNDIGPITRDAFDVPSDDILVTGNIVHDIQAPQFYIESVNKEPFDVSLNNEFNVYYDELNSGSYVNYQFTNIGARAANPSSATAQEIVNELMSNSGFASKLYASDENGKLRITALRTNYLQHLYIDGNANTAFGFLEQGIANNKSGSGQHADVFQYWASSTYPVRKNIIIRNNKAYDVDSQGLLPQANTTNLAFINNLIDAKGISWIINFEGFNYTNVLFEHNTIWDRTLSSSITATSPHEYFVFRNNIYGPVTGAEDVFTTGNNEMDYNIYDYSGTYPPAALNLHSIDTNPSNSVPATTPLFLNVQGQSVNKKFCDTCPSQGLPITSKYEYSGDFHVNENSPAKDFGVDAGIRYDIDWNLRDARPDAGAYEYINANSGIFYVSINGAGNHDGSLGNAFNLSEALMYAQLHPNDEINFLISGGDYGEFLYATDRSVWMTWKNASQGLPVFSNIEIGDGSSKNAYVRFEGFNISSRENFTGRIVYLNNINYVEFGNCIIRGNDMYNMSGLVILGDNFKIQGCDISFGRKVHSGRPQPSVDAIHILSGRGEIINNNIHDFAGSGIIADAGQVLIENNSLYNQWPYWEGWSGEELLHGSCIAIHSDNITIIGNTIHSCGSSQAIGVYGPVAGWDGVADNIVIEKNVLYDVKEIDFTGSSNALGIGRGVKLNNNTIIAFYDKGPLGTGPTRFQIAVRLDKNDFNTGYGNDFEFKNNIIVGIVSYRDNPPAIIESGNLIWAVDSGPKDVGLPTYKFNYFVNNTFPNSRIYSWSSPAPSSYNDVFENGVFVQRDINFSFWNYQVQDFHPLMNSLLCNGSLGVGGVAAAGALGCIGSDITLPVISNIINSSITNQSAIVSWNTNENANSRVWYGLTIAFGSSVSNVSYLMSPSLQILNLLSNITYYYKVGSCDASGNCANSSVFNFKTLAGEYLDNEPPVIALGMPINNSVANSNSITFTYTPSDYSSMPNCTLFIGIETRIDFEIENNIENNFVLTLENGDYIWNISCVDARGNVGISESRNLSVNYQAPPAETPSSGGGGGGFPAVKPKPSAKNMSNVSVAAEELEKIILGDNLSFIDIGANEEEKVLVDIYGNSYAVSFVLSEDGRVLAKLFNGDYIIPRGEVLPIGLGKEEMYVGVVKSDIGRAKVVLGLDANAVKEKVGKVEGGGGGIIEEGRKFKGLYYALIGIVGVLIVMIIVLVVWYFVKSRKEVWAILQTSL